MGCDVHLHIEVKERSTGIWHHLANPRIDRGYQFFSHLADCGRGHNTPVIPNRGIPGDITPVTRHDLDRYGSEAHSLSWFGPEEIEKLRDRLAGQPGYDEYHDDLEHGIFRTYLLGNSLTSLEGTPYGDIRLVFWFDG